MPSRHLFKHLLHDERGATAIEYGLIVSLIVIAMIATFNIVADNTIGMWENVEVQIEKNIDN